MIFKKSHSSADEWLILCLQSLPGGAALRTAIEILSNTMPPWGWGIYFLVAAAVFLFCQHFMQHAPARKAILINYMIFVLLITLLTRTQKAHPTAAWQPFWSWQRVIVSHNQRLAEEILLNLLMLLPVGILFASIYRRMPLRRAFYIGALFSSAIEISQLVLRLGLFEWDDIIHNTLGCVLGAAIVRGIQCRLEKRTASTSTKYP